MGLAPRHQPGTPRPAALNKEPGGWGEELGVQKLTRSGFEEGLLKGKFAFLEACKVLYMRGQNACETPIFASKKDPVLNAL